MESRDRRFEATIDSLENRLNQAQWQLNWFESSRGVRLVKLARASRAVLTNKGPLALAKQATLWTVGKRGYHLSDISGAQYVPQTSGQKAVIFISGGPAEARRYRCIHQSEELGFQGYTTDFAEHGSIDLDSVVAQYSCFILHRVPYGPEL